MPPDFNMSVTMKKRFVLDFCCMILIIATVANSDIETQKDKQAN